MYCVSCSMAARSAASGEAADGVQRVGGGDRRRGDRGGEGQEAGGDALAVGLAEGDEPHARGDDVGGEGLEPERRGGQERQREQARGVADGDRVGHGGTGMPVGGAGGAGEGRALRHGLEMALGGGGERLGELGDRRGIGGAPGRGEQERVGAPGAVLEEVGDPGGEASRPVTQPASTAHSSPCE